MNCAGTLFYQSSEGIIQYSSIAIQFLFDQGRYFISQDIKGVIRNAYNHYNMASQITLPVEVSKESGDKLLGTSPHRIHSSVLDLLYRQLGLIFDLPSALYKYAGLESGLANQLHTIGFYLLRTSKYEIFYPIAVRICPQGQFWLHLPGQDQGWLTYTEGARLIGRMFASEDWCSFNLSKQECADFAVNILTQFTEPTLALFEAENWRGRDLFPQFANIYQQPNVLDLQHLPSKKALLRPEDLPHLRIIRIRTTGILGETPQYIPLKEGLVSKDLNYLGGYVDIQADSPFFHYLSIGRYPDTIDRTQKRSNKYLYKMDYGDIAFKHQTVVEFVPVFLQKTDDPLHWCRIPQLLRSSSA